jgi:hypothetical protein
MTVYVDTMKAKYRGMIMCHMVADTIEELHNMAMVLGLRKYFQSQAKYPHYDISFTKKAEAMKLGAIEVTQKELLLKAKKLKSSIDK